MKLFVVLGLLAAMVSLSSAVMQGSLAKSASEPIQASVGESGADLNIIELANRLYAYNFLLVLKETNLTEIVRNAHDITVFIPTNDAWNAISDETRDYLRKNPQAYRDLVKYHVVQGLFPENSLEDEESLTTLNDNRKARFNIYNHTGIPDIKTYMGSVVNSANNFTATNGYIHFINQVVDHVQTEGPTIDLVNSASELTKLALLVKAAGSKEVFSLLTGTKHTLFAPSDKAFAKLPSGVFDKMLKNPKIAERVILDHITHFGTYFTNGVVDGEHIPTVDFRKNITVKKYSSGKIRLNDRADITSANNPTDTGVVHFINTLLSPPSEV